MGVGPKELKDNADRTLFLLDQDGPVPDDAERARRRGVSTAPQGPDGMTRLTATLTPPAWAIFEAIFATWAAPGMCHPDDPEPCISGTPTQDRIDGDHRSLAQRRHDALMAVGRSVVASGELGRHHGLTTSVIIRTTLQDLQSRAGVGVTGGGTVIPIAEVIGLAAQAVPYLAVFDRATGSALNLFRARRSASPAQRVMLIARDGGCTKPGCTVPAYGSQVHHAARDWAHGGLTNVDELGLACGVDNRMVGEHGWTTRLTAVPRRGVDPPAEPGHRPNPHQRLPPPRTALPAHRAHPDGTHRRPTQTSANPAAPNPTPPRPQARHPDRRRTTHR